MNLRERFGLQRHSGETLDQQTFGLSTLSWVLYDPNKLEYRGCLAFAYGLMESAVIPITARRYREGAGIMASAFTLSGDLLTKSLVEYAFNSADQTTSALIMGAAALIIRSGASHLAVNLLQNNFRKPRLDTLPLQFRDLGPIA